MPTKEIDKCQFASDGQCMVSTMLSGLPVAIEERMCVACRMQDSPMGINRITCGRAAAATKESGKPLDPDIQRCLAPRMEGIGTEAELAIAIWRYRLSWIGLGWLLEQSDDCGCESLKFNLNAISLLEAEQHLRVFAGQMHDNWRKRFPKTWIPTWLANSLARHVLRKAIKNYRLKQSLRSACGANAS